MRSILIPAVLSALALMSGCGDGDPADEAGTDATAVPAAIERSIAENCKTTVSRAGFPSLTAYTGYRGRAEESFVIRCGAPARRWVDTNFSAYARFSSPDVLHEALASIALPPAEYEELCITNREAFTVGFWGSDPVCKQASGQIRKFRSPPRPSAASERTYAAGSGQTANLVFKPPHWSNGGTGGSDILNAVVWKRWTTERALGTGTSGLRGPCVTDGKATECTGEAAYYQAPARVKLDQPQPCRDQGVVIRHFSRAQYEVYMRPDNPFGEPMGWLRRTHLVPTYRGKCTVFEGGSFAWRRLTGTPSSGA